MSVPAGYEAFSTFNPQQAQLFQQLLASLGGTQGLNQNPLFQSGQTYLQNLLSGSPEAFEQFERPFKRQFEEQTIPALAERFSSMGAGAQRSGAFQQALSQAAAGLSENLASLRGQLQLGAIPQALGFAQAPFNQLQSLLGMNTMGFTPKQKPWWQELLTGAAPGIGQAAGLGGLAGLSKIPGLGFLQNMFGKG
jgi:hypothetical protein